MRLFHSFWWLDGIGDGYTEHDWHIYVASSQCWSRKFTNDESLAVTDTPLCCGWRRSVPPLFSPPACTRRWTLWFQILLVPCYTKTMIVQHNIVQNIIKATERAHDFKASTFWKQGILFVYGRCQEMSLLVLIWEFLSWPFSSMDSDVENRRNFQKSLSSIRTNSTLHYRKGSWFNSAVLDSDFWNTCCSHECVPIPVLSPLEHHSSFPKKVWQASHPVGSYR